jgi:hypothetical protein
MDMKIHRVALLLMLLTLAACTADQEAEMELPSPTVRSRPTSTPPPTATTYVTPTAEGSDDFAREGDSLPSEQNNLFSTSGSCSVCHTNLTDESGEDVSIDTNWRASMMANAARDPYWLATVREEMESHPELAETIEEQCSRCHMPMAHLTSTAEGDPVSMFGEGGFLNPDHNLHTFAMDGVSCAVCHQIREDNLGQSSSYSGGFYIDTELRAPDRLIFGPYTIDDRQADIMQGASGYRPEQGLHLSKSDLCATCHTLYTPYVDAAGNVAGEFPEQVPYFEWFYSDYRRTRTCQDCHMPDAGGGVKISITSEALRSPFAVHGSVGGNAYMLELMDTFGDELGLTASSEDFEGSITRTLDLLQNDTADITLEEVRQSGPRIFANVVVENLAGHKFPTAYPSRRAWLRFVVRDANDQIVFESGGFNSDGSIMGNANDEDPTMLEQHYEAIVQPEQVQIYEAILQDTENDVTTDLLKAASYRKDNRLLPAGFEKGAPYEDIAVRGDAREDEDFLGGTDTIQYVVDVGSSQGPFAVTVELLYQSIGYRWVENFRSSDVEEAKQFLGYYDQVPNEPVIISSAEVEVGG